MMIEKNRLKKSFNVGSTSHLTTADFSFQRTFCLTDLIEHECSIQTDQFVIDDEEQQRQSTVHFNNLIIDVNKGTEVTSLSTNKNASRDEQIRRTFKFPFLRLPIINNSQTHDFDNIKCAKCQSSLKIINADSQTFKIVQQQNTNTDEINEVMYCHRFCEAHQHEHKHYHEHQLHVPLDLHAELIVLENIESFIIAKEYVSSNLIQNESIQCYHCSTCLGLFDTQNNLISFNKSSLLPYSSDYLSSCFRYQEPGRYIVKVAKSNDSIYLVWILPNQMYSADATIDLSCGDSAELRFYRTRRLLFAHATSSDNKTFTEWKRDFSVTTLLVNQQCLDHLSTTFEHEIRTFPNMFDSNETFQSVTIFC